MTQPSSSSRHAMLATDLDGTLIPLDDHPENRQDLKRLVEELRRAEIRLAFVTGRHLELVREAMGQHDLPPPEWLICDVGTTIYEPLQGADAAEAFRSSGETGSPRLRPMPAYVEHLAEITGDWDVDRLAQRLASIDGPRKQEAEKQGRFKLSYYNDREQLDRVVAEMESSLQQVGAPYRIIASVDPFTGDGLIDLLPQGASKSHALDWLVRHAGLHRDQVLFAGDSGNDLAALTAGYHSIVVGNAAPEVAEEAKRAHREAGWSNRLYLAERPATSGVLEGLRHFLDRQAPT